MCQISKRYGKRVQATTVHHIFPREEFPAYAYSSWNLISVASDVHDSLHCRQSQELTERGKDLLRRTARKHGKTVPEKYK